MILPFDVEMLSVFKTQNRFEFLFTFYMLHALVRNKCASDNDSFNLIVKLSQTLSISQSLRDRDFSKGHA